jgi:hypothetical protein
MADIKVTQGTTAQPDQVAAAQRARNIAPAFVDPLPAASQPMSTQEFQRAVTRMNQKLDTGQPRQDVPRGFYLNVRV